jgi:hypothetical protein
MIRMCDVRYLDVKGGSGLTRMSLEEIPKWLSDSEGRMIIGITTTQLLKGDPDEYKNKQVAAEERERCAKMLENASQTGRIVSCISAAKAIRAMED